MNELIARVYEGIGVHDGLKSYARYTCDHALCNAHHLRELEFITGRCRQIWAKEMGILLRDLKQQVAQAKAQGETALWGKLVQWFENRYQPLIAAFLATNPSPEPPPDAAKFCERPKQTPAKNLLDRLQQHQAQVLALMYDFRVPFDNNQAQRDLRMMKLSKRFSVVSAPLQGHRCLGGFADYISTFKKQRLNVLEALKQVFLGNPTMPTMLQPE